MLSLAFFLITNASAATDCTQLENNLKTFQTDNKKNQDANLNFVQQVSDRLRKTQGVASSNVKTKLEAMEKTAPLTSSAVTPVVDTELAPISTMADETDTVLNEAYDNNETINKRFKDLINQIRDCLPKGP